MSKDYRDKFDYETEFAFTNKACWNEEMPFITIRSVGGQRRVVIPKFEATQLGDPKYGTRDAERHGPFPIAVAIDSPIPIYWIDEQAQTRTAIAAINQVCDPLGLLSIGESVYASLTPNPETKQLEKRTDRVNSRLIVIGSGNVFNGRDLKPSHEQLLLHCCNWLIGRDGRLPKEPDSVETSNSAKDKDKNKIWQYPRVKVSQERFGFWEIAPWIAPPIIFLYFGTIVWLIRRLR